MLPTEFFLVDDVDLTPRLLGKFLRRDDDVILQITEVEAYRPGDSACHGSFGVTARTAPVFGPGGHAYGYLCHGLHTMLNVVADKEGVGAAVLIRSRAPIKGLDTIQKRRRQLTDKPVLLAGPGKVGQALGNFYRMVQPPSLYPWWSRDPGRTESGEHTSRSRVGIEYALPEHVNAPWRFANAGCPWVSSPRNTLRPD